MKRPLKRRKQGERGFALLLVFLMASAVALMLYMQVPREAFESERDKEQMLIDRGEQYKRAIYMYYVSNNRAWPARIRSCKTSAASSAPFRKSVPWSPSWAGRMTARM